MQSIPVTPSGSVGKQTYAQTSDPVTLRGFLLSPLSANAHVTIRDGGSGASGEIVHRFAAFSAETSRAVKLPGRGQRFDKGMHVTVLGTNAVCYLYVD